MGFWSTIGSEKIKNAKSTEGGLYLPPGNFVVQISKCKMIKTMEGADAFIAEFSVIESDVEKMKVGEQPSYYVGFGKFPTLSLGNIVDFMRAGLASLAEAHGEEHPPISEIEVNEDVAEAITGTENILAGTYLAVYAFNKKTKDGGDFTRMKWSVPKNVAELAAQ